VREANKKFLVIAVALMAVAMLATPMIGMVQAGKGQEKQYFKIYLVGLPNESTGEIRWTPDPDTGPMKHGREVEWGLVDVLEVTIGDNTITEGISYSCKICADYNSVTFKGVQRIRETITFSDIDGEEGALEILAIGKLGAEGATFTGHGTGALEGVKVGGTTWGGIIPWSGGGPPVRLEVTREGTVMGWPT
jgi:hypothetical protein